MMAGSWHWHGETHLTCDLLAGWRHQFGGRLGSQEFPGVKNYRLRQIHSGLVLSTTDVQLESAGDGLMATQPGQALWVCSADCVPVLIGCLHTGTVAALHAGWRGTAAKIIPTAVQKLLHQGSTLSSLRIALGPAISGSNYQVQNDVVAALAATLVTPDQPTVAAVIGQWQEQPQLLRPDGERWRLDLRQVQVQQLLQLGVELDQIAVSPHCTYADPERFYSYRRDGKTQVQWSGILSR
ncbi:peptidoglycan editing factor PgeF [Gloeomargaritales cyanobacterium VI4D9]|nr:peptidoglycan editing factor PgeF [Gloeomargaritales cyanobacterium VI4D9]